ncbi:MAG: acyltransferase [Cyclobacteriaceae bacterium]|nr:acyltransferase [Cyclobacteriaceae bacterium]
MNSATRPYLTTLTPLRGIAALLVVIFHSNLMLMPFVEPFTKPNLINAGWLWVDFFFVLSGFIIFYVYGDSFRNTLTATSYWKYIKARFARVYPLHFFTLLWCLGCALIILHYAEGVAPFYQTMFNPFSAIPSLLFLQSLGLYIAAPLNSPSWSLSTEWWVYMIFPLMVPFFSRLKNVGLIITLAGVAGFFLFIKYVLGPINSFPPGTATLNVLTDFGFFRCLAGFLTGMLAFRVYEKSIGITFFKKSWVFIAFVTGVLITMHVGVEDILIVAIFPFIILAAAHNSTTIKKALETQVLQRLGDWSFSIYLVHVPIMYIFWIVQVRSNPTLYANFSPESSGPPDYTMGLWVCLIVVALTLVVSSITYRYIEVPARSYLNKKFNPKELETVKVVR